MEIEADDKEWKVPSDFATRIDDELSRAITRMAEQYRELTRHPSGYSGYVDSRMSGELRESMEIAWTLPNDKREAVNAILRRRKLGWDGLIGILRDVQCW